MNASEKNGAKQSVFGVAGPEMVESAAALGREALERTMRLTAEATVRACRGAAAAGTAQLEAAQALRGKMDGGGGEYVAALSASTDAAVTGIETCMEKTIDYTRAAADAGVESVSRSLAATTMNEWVGVQMDSATRMMNLGLAQAGEIARIVTDTSTRCAEPLGRRAESATKPS
ncbi:MAG: phasin family protein [Immundisolibacterales bacterium]|nr:phasin family protein [Immundisolibacterales bacterium]